MRLFFKKARDVLVDDALSKALDDGGLADAGFADQHRIVLCSAAKNLDQSLDLGLAADKRIEFALRRRRRSDRG